MVGLCHGQWYLCSELPLSVQLRSNPASIVAVILGFGYVGSPPTEIVKYFVVNISENNAIYEDRAVFADILYYIANAINL